MLKIHPACRIDLKNFSNLTFNSQTRQSESYFQVTILHRNLTGAANEAYCWTSHCS